MAGFNMKVTPEIEQLTEACKDHTTMDLSLYGKYDVKRGLRDINGKGVLAGLTQVSNVQAVKVVDGKEVPCAGSLYYRGYNIKDLTNGLHIFFCSVLCRMRSSLRILRNFWQISGHFREILSGMSS